MAISKTEGIREMYSSMPSEPRALLGWTLLAMGAAALVGGYVHCTGKCPPPPTRSSKEKKKKEHQKKIKPNKYQRIPDTNSPKPSTSPSYYKKSHFDMRQFYNTPKSYQAMHQMHQDLRKQTRNFRPNIVYRT